MSVDKNIHWIWAAIVHVSPLRGRRPNWRASFCSVIIIRTNASGQTWAFQRDSNVYTAVFCFRNISTNKQTPHSLFTNLIIKNSAHEKDSQRFMDDCGSTSRVDRHRYRSICPWQYLYWTTILINNILITTLSSCLSVASRFLRILVVPDRFSTSSSRERRLPYL